MIRRSCAHCGNDLWVRTERFGSSPWLFAKCPSCSGTSLVKTESFSNDLPAPRFREVAKRTVIAPPPPLPPAPVAPQQSREKRISFRWDTASVAASVGLILLAVQWRLDLSDRKKTAPVAVSVSPVAVAQAPVLAPTSDLVTTSHAAPQVVASHETPSRAPGILLDTGRKTGRAWVKVIPAAAILRSGPGKQYPKVGVARAELRLLVKSSTDAWVEIENPVSQNDSTSTAWVRSDLVRSDGFLETEQP